MADERVAPVPAGPEPVVAETHELKVPAPNVTGNARVQILKHGLVDAVVDPQDSGKRSPAGVEFAISNVSGTTIATLVFEALFYDDEGNVLDSVRHRVTDLPPATSRGILISSGRYEPGQVTRYDVRLIRSITADVERVQLRRHDISTTADGEEAVHGIVKNISPVKTDAAVVVTFYDFDKENLGTKVVLLRDIEPDTIRQYDLRFKPQEGDTVASYGVAIGEIVA